MVPLTPEDAEEFMYNLNIGDLIEIDSQLGNDEKREIVHYKGKVILKNENTFWLREDDNKEYNSPQVVWPQSILEFNILDSPLTKKFGKR